MVSASQERGWAGRRRPTVLLLLLIALVLPACGGGRLTKAEYLERLGEILLKYESRLSLVEAPPGQSDKIRESVDGWNQFIDELADLNPPEEIEATHDDFVNRLRDYATVYADYADATAEGDTAASERLKEQLAAVAEQTFNEPAEEFEAKGYDIEEAVEAARRRRLQEAGVREFPIPTAESAPGEIAAGPDGNLWFTEITANKIGRITTSGTITEFPIATADSYPGHITSGSDGNMWFTEISRRIGRITTAGAITEFTLPGRLSNPGDITSGPDGYPWYTDGDKVGWLTTSGTATEFRIRTRFGTAQNITSGPDGNLWFTVSGPISLRASSDKIGRVTTAGSVTEFTIPTEAAGPGDITSGPDGNLWFTECRGQDVDTKTLPGGAIGRITTSGVITEFPIRADTFGCPHHIASGPDGNLWFTYASDQAAIGQITTSGAITLIPLVGVDTEPAGITSGPDGNLWFTLDDAIGMLRP